MNLVTQSISFTPNLQEIQAFTIAIPHLSKVATELTDFIDDENLMQPFLALGKFYYGQGIYNQAEQWWEQCLVVCQKRLWESHPDVAISLNNLAGLYESQGKYEVAEPLYLEALELSKQLLGEQHPQVATSLNNLAALYRSQGKYEVAEPLYLQAIAIAESVLGENHPNTQTMQENFNRCLIMKYLAMPEAEMRQVLPEEVCEELLQYKKTMSNEQSTVNSQH